MKNENESGGMGYPPKPAVDNLPKVPEKVDTDSRIMEWGGFPVGLLGGIAKWEAAQPGDELEYDVWGGDKSHNTGKFEVTEINKDDDIVIIKGFSKSVNRDVEVRFVIGRDLSARIE